MQIGVIDAVWTSYDNNGQYIVWNLQDMLLSTIQIFNSSIYLVIES